MFKDVAHAMDSGLLPIIGLIAFVAAFVLIIIWAFTMRKEDRTAAKNIPLNDSIDSPLDTDKSYAS